MRAIDLVAGDAFIWCNRKVTVIEAPKFKRTCKLPRGERDMYLIKVKFNRIFDETHEFGYYDDEEVERAAPCNACACGAINWPDDGRDHITFGIITHEARDSGRACSERAW